MSEQEKPQSTAPNFNDIEQEILARWDEQKTFQKSLEQTKDGTPYIFYDGPPFATGLPHYGSILPSVYKDAIPRYQTMQGRYVRRRWGWDCHGLPIENIVEQNLKISGKKQIEEIGIERFNKVCRDNVLNYTVEWGKTIKRIARWVEFDNAYKTMDTSYMESVWWALKQIWDKQLIYEDRKVLLYCSRCETPISNFEVAMDNSYKDITETSVYVKFKLIPKQRIGDYLTGENTYAVAWTTTPWTLPGNTALNIGPDISYVVVEQNGQDLIVAKDRLSILEGELGSASGGYEEKSQFSARSLEGISYEPLYAGVVENSESTAHKIYAEDYVTTTDGTGIVHNAAMYGEEDYEAAKRRNLPRVPMLDQKGQYMENAPSNLKGLFFKDADKIVLAELIEKGLVYKTENYTHSYPHCYRCSTPLFYNAISAWFINIQKVKPELLKNNQDVSWYPGHLKDGRFAQGLENAPDWNISRNRYWATALPFWKCENKECKTTVCIGSVAELQAQSKNFAEVYPNYDSQNLEDLDLHRPFIDLVKLNCIVCGGTMQRIPEVVDCWVESGSMPFAELHAPFENQELFNQRFPADFVVEYIPQTRAWFYVMHVLSTILFGKAPFKNVVTTGTILAEDGTKMSKSKNNYPDPQLIIDKYGADALRFYLLSSPVTIGEDINFSEKSVSEISRKVNMLLYNVWSFYRMYEKGQAPLTKPDAVHVLDRWILAKLAELTSFVTTQLDNYNTVKAGKEVVEFINDLSTWYVRRSRDRFKEGGESSKEALAVFGYVLVETSKLLAPFMPYLSDFIFTNITGLESVHLTTWTKINADEIDKKLLRDMEVVREAVSVGHSARKELSLGVRQPLRAVFVQTKNTDSELDADLSELVIQELNIKQLDPSLVDKAGLRPETVKTFSGTQAVASLLIDIELTPELRSEGLARELERQIQDLRKKSGLQVGQLVDLYYNTQDPDLESALIGLVDRKKTFVNQILKSLEVEVDFEIQANVSGQPIWLGIINV